jgi:sarcosine oxidase subunit beta
MRSTADVVIVGGGCMGASAAFHLAQRGVRDVVLVEREPQLGAGSTGRNAGGVRHQFTSEANVRLSIESIRAIACFEDEVGAVVDFHRDGYLFLLSRDDSVAAFRTALQMQRRLGVEVDELAPAEAARLAPGLVVDGVMAATFCAQDGIADPGALTLGYARGARERGVEIVRGVEVTGIRVIGDRVAAVTTTAGAIDTRTVVNAAGPWARHVGSMAGLDVPIDPLRRHIFLAQPTGTSENGWNDPVHAGKVPSSRIMVIDFETSFYFHREGARLLFGMGDRQESFGFDTTVKWDFLPEVIEVAARRLPALLDAEISHAWAGLYEMTPDAMPIIGPTTLEGYFVLAGFSGHGFQHAPAAGRVLADILVGAPPGLDLTSFAFSRFARGRVEPERGFV